MLSVIKKHFTTGALAILLLAPAAPAAVLSFSGAFSTDADVAFIQLQLNSNSTIDVRTFSYGGWLSPAVPSGGFAPALGLYDSTGTLVANDFVGGTAVGPNCSNGALQDPLTGFCEDATLSFSGLSGTYTLLLAVQPNNPPSSLTDPFFLSPGTNFPGGPFLDPGDITGSTIRNSNWYLQISLDGTADLIVPEPLTITLSAAGLLAVVLRRRQQLSQRT